MALIQIDQLIHRFGKQEALQSLSITIEKGEFVGLAGPDGAGKTTLIRLLAGLFLPTEGYISIAGFNTVSQAAQIHERIGYMPQRFGLYEDLTVLQNLVLYADLKGVLGQERQETFERLLAFTGLKPFIKRLAGNLSGGMKQKLGLACTLIRKPIVLLLDEPSVGVDPISRRELWKMVQELLQDGITVIWSTTYLDEAEKCKRVLLLNEGKLLFDGVPSDLTQRVDGRCFKVHNIPGSRRAALFQLIQMEGVVDGTIQGADLRLVLKTKNPLAMDLSGAACVPTPPRFEDAFVDLLGGGPKGISKLAEASPQIVSQNGWLIEAEELTKRFGSFTAADKISFRIRAGEVFGLLGPNGAGKSTTFKMLCGLQKPTSGRAIFNGKNMDKASAEVREHIGYMAQKFSLYDGLSVWQNLKFFSGIYLNEKASQIESVSRMIDIFHLQEFLSENAQALPLGYKQRLALACAAMHYPQALFLDEPTSGVDPITRREFWNHINGLVEKGTTVVVTTHFMDEAEYCDRIALIYQGKTITMGTPEELKAQARSPACPNPTMEDTFIALIEKSDGK